MKLVIKEKNKYRINRLIEWILYMIGYTLVFIIITSLFKSIHIDEPFLLWSSIAVLIIYALNKTIKPLIVTITIPITGITLGLFYPCINLFILKLVDWILVKHFEMSDIWIALLVAILLSITNFIMEELMKKMISKVKKQHE